jgi:fibronectin type 3 domain-containing protein
MPRRFLSPLLALVALAIALGGCRAKASRAAAERAGSHSVTLNWHASASPVAGYRIYRATNATDPPGLIGVTLADTTTFKDTSVQAGHQYFYVVTAFDSAHKESVVSNKTSVTVPSP